MITEVALFNFYSNPTSLIPTLGIRVWKEDGHARWLLISAEGKSESGSSESITNTESCNCFSKTFTVGNQTGRIYTGYNTSMSGNVFVQIGIGRNESFFQYHNFEVGISITSFGRTFQNMSVHTKCNYGRWEKFCLVSEKAD